MRIAVLSYPRTGSTHLTTLLAKIYNLKGFQNEPLTGNFIKEQKLNILQNFETMDEYIIKFMSHNFLNLSYTMLDWNKFDQLYLIERRNLVDGCISNYVALTTNRWLRLKNEDSFDTKLFILPEKFIFDYIMYIRVFNEIKNYIQQTVKESKLIFKTYEEICEENIENGRTIPMGINYKEKCLNYTEVEAKFKELGYGSN